MKLPWLSSGCTQATTVWTTPSLPSLELVSQKPALAIFKLYSTVETRVARKLFGCRDDMQCTDTFLQEVSHSVNWCFEPSQPLGITSGLRETFIKRYIVERTIKAERYDRKNRVRKRRVVGRIYGMKYSLKGHEDRNRHKDRMKRRGQALCLT